MAETSVLGSLRICGLCHACEHMGPGFLCLWILGLVAEADQPNECGVIAGPVDPREELPPEMVERLPAGALELKWAMVAQSAWSPDVDRNMERVARALVEQGLVAIIAGENDQPLARRIILPHRPG